MLEAPIEARTDETVALDLAMAEQATLGPDDTGTVMLTGAATRSGDLHADNTVERPASPETTVVLSGESKRMLHDTGKMLLRAKADPELIARTRVHVSSEAAETSGGNDPGEATTFYAPLASETGVVVPSAKAPSWSLRFALLAASMAVLAFLLLALPLMRTLGNALVEESQLRGRALLDVLAAANEAALGQARLQDVSVSRVVHETGVIAAYVVDAEGALVAPPDDAGGPLRLGGVEVDFTRLSRLLEPEAADGDYVVAKPIAYRGRPVGVAGAAVPTASWWLLLDEPGARSGLVAHGTRRGSCRARREAHHPLPAKGALRGRCRPSRWTGFDGIRGASLR